MEYSIKAPLINEDINCLRAGDCILLSGVVYTARDAAHQRIVKAIKTQQSLPFDVTGQVIYYTGPCPGTKGRVLGSCGPTTSGRLDGYTPLLLEKGLKGMIGKGQRSPEVVQAIRDYGAVYFVTVGGAGALLSTKIKKAEVVAYPELGPEAVMRLEIVEFPCLVAIDSMGNSLYR
ncbi:MAG: FumA C-terminus/TtdB family hydratase beta subunit [Chitinophagales bacterium]